MAINAQDVLDLQTAATILSDGGVTNVKPEVLAGLVNWKNSNTAPADPTPEPTPIVHAPEPKAKGTKGSTTEEDPGF